MRYVRILGCFAEPYMPSFSAKLYEILNIKYTDFGSTLIGRIHKFIKENQESGYKYLLEVDLIQEGQAINEPLPIFKKISDEEMIEFKKMYEGGNNQ